MSFHFAYAAGSPRRVKQLIALADLICPNSGSTVVRLSRLAALPVSLDIRVVAEPLSH